MASSPCPVILLTLAGDVPGLSRFLASGNATPDAVDARRRTGLHHAAARGLSSPMSTLLASGADPDFRDARGNTPLHLCGHGPTLALLMGYGADPRVTNVHGATAKDMMRRRGVPQEIVDRLEDYERRFDTETEINLDYEDNFIDDDDDGVERIALRQRRFLDNPEERSLSAFTEDSSIPEASNLDRRLIDDDDHHRDHHHNDDDAVSFLHAACHRRRRLYRAARTEDDAASRPLSVFHEFFLSLDARTLILVVLCVFVLALFAAFYVTGVKMNYFEWWGEAKDVVVEERERGFGEDVKVVPLKAERDRYCP